MFQNSVHGAAILQDNPWVHSYTTTTSSKVTSCITPYTQLQRRPRKKVSSPNPPLNIEPSLLETSFALEFPRTEYPRAHWTKYMWNICSRWFVRFVSPRTTDVIHELPRWFVKHRISTTIRYFMKHLGDSWGRSHSKLSTTVSKSYLLVVHKLRKRLVQTKLI